MTRGATRGHVERLRGEVSRALVDAGVGAGDPLLVACSHGPDSLSLADAILHLRRVMRLGPVTLVYVHHGLREGADAEGLAVEAFAARHGAGARIAQVVLDRGRGGGLEEAARAARYAALEAAADGVGARWIALGHTASDQAETLLHRLVRGAGVVGAAAIPAVRGRYLRPLLSLSRAEVEAYVRARRLAPSHDETNADRALTRNRIRHDILPLLRTLNPSVDESLARAAAALRESADVLDWAAGQARTQVCRKDDDGSIAVDAAALTRLPAAIAKRLLTITAAALGAALEARHLEALVALAARPAGRVVERHLPSIRARRQGGHLILVRTASNRLKVALTGVTSAAIHEKPGHVPRARQ